MPSATTRSASATKRAKAQVIEASPKVVEIRRDDGSAAAEIELIENVRDDLLFGDGMQIDPAKTDHRKRLPGRCGCAASGGSISAGPLDNPSVPGSTDFCSRICVPQIHETLSPKPNFFTGPTPGTVPERIYQTRPAQTKGSGREGSNNFSLQQPLRPETLYNSTPHRTPCRPTDASVQYPLPTDGFATEIICVRRLAYATSTPIPAN